MAAIRVGELVVQPVFDGTARLHAGNWAGADWTEHRHLLADDDTMTVPVGGFLVRVGERVVLLDAGIGDLHDEMFDGGQLLDSLRALGVAPAGIDTVVISHLHSDHMGWLATADGPVFPNATVHIGAADWDFFVEQGHGGRRRGELLRRVEPQVSLVDTDGATVAPGVTMRLTPGHTPGHLSTVLRDAEQPGTALLPCHFPGMQAARLLPASGSRRWVLSGSG